MKIRLHLLFFMFTFLVSHTGFTQEDYKDTKLVSTIFKALKKQDEKKVLKALPTLADIKHLIPIVSAAQPDYKFPEADAILAEFKMRTIEDFKKASKKGTAFGVVWEDIELKDVRYTSNPDPNVAIERGDFVMECISHDTSFLITMKKSSKIRGTWRLMNTLKFTLL
ncbi:hypothetical protein ACFFVB_12740 [Formosa undariae]|uniref:DUF4440 domain-containing protein n=1 Tax=Formosa undariae TaxID=1325436 RepID=A0ABV5F3B6_9FLAO